MRKLTVAFLAFGLAFAQSGCDKKKTEEKSETGSAKSAKDSEGTPSAREGGEATEAREAGEARQGTEAREAGEARQGTEARAAGEGTDDVVARFPELAKILEKQKAMGKLMEGVESVADLEKRKDDLMKLSAEVLDMTLNSLREAVKMPKDKLKDYLMASVAMNKANAEFAKRMSELQGKIMELEGAKAFFEKLQKDTADKVKDKTDELMKLMQEVGKRQAEVMGE